MFPKYLSIFIYLFLYFCFPSSNSKIYDHEIILSENSFSFDGRQVNNSVININFSNTYLFKGSSSNCSILASGQAIDITFDSVTLENSERIPFLIERNSKVFLGFTGVNKIIDKSSEGAAIKAKSGTYLTIGGNGTLIISGNSKNGIEGEEGSDLETGGGTYNITCVNDAISFPGNIFFSGGIFNIKTSNGIGIKSDPNSPPPENGYNGGIYVYEASFNINSYGDAFLSKNTMHFTFGIFNIITENGKGFRVTNTQDNESINIQIEGTNFYLDTIDDAFYSSGNITIGGGNFNIRTGKSGFHAEKILSLGAPDINITKSLRGIEGGQIFLNGPTIKIIASDSGIFSGGGTTNNKRSLNYGNLNYRKTNEREIKWSFDSDININAGNIYINSEKNGIETKGDITIYNAYLEIWGAKSGSNGDFINLDGKMVISGATLFAAGNVKQPDKWDLSQDKINGANKVNENYYVGIVRKNKTKRCYKAPKSVDYLYYTDPNVNSTFYNFSITYTKPNITDEDENNGKGNYYGSEDYDEDEDEDEDDILPIHKKGENIKYNIVLLMMIFAFILNV